MTGRTRPESGQTYPTIRAIGITKSFGHVDVLRGVDIEVYPGQIVGLVGDNGAGKSTLMSIIAGDLSPDEGQLILRGESVEFSSAQDAHRHGIQTVYQDLALASTLTVAENIFLGHERIRDGWWQRLGTLQREDMWKESNDALATLGIRLPSVKAKVKDLSGGQRQAVAVARAVRWAESAILMDEPTAALGREQAGLVYRTIEAAASEGLALLIVSHDIPALLEHAGTIAVLRRGQIVANRPTKDLDLATVVGLMLGAGAESGSKNSGDAT